MFGWAYCTVLKFFYYKKYMVDRPVQDETRMIKVFNKYGSDEKVHFGVRQKTICNKSLTREELSGGAYP